MHDHVAVDKIAQMRMLRIRNGILVAPQLAIRRRCADLKHVRKLGPKVRFRGTLAQDGSDGRDIFAGSAPAQVQKSRTHHAQEGDVRTISRNEDGTPRVLEPVKHAIPPHFRAIRAGNLLLPELASEDPHTVASRALCGGGDFAVIESVPARRRG